MGLIKRESYIKCKGKEDNSGVLCIAYKPDKEGNKRIIATAEFNTTADGEVTTLTHDGDENEIDKLTRHALKYAKRGKNTTGDF